jgi:hypothetical protein
MQSLNARGRGGIAGARGQRRDVAAVARRVDIPLTFSRDAVENADDRRLFLADAHA